MFLYKVFVVIALGSFSFVNAASITPGICQDIIGQPNFDINTIVGPKWNIIAADPDNVVEQSVCTSITYHVDAISTTVYNPKLNSKKVLATYKHIATNPDVLQINDAASSPEFQSVIVHPSKPTVAFLHRCKQETPWRCKIQNYVMARPNPDGTRQTFDPEDLPIFMTVLPIKNVEELVMTETGVGC